MSAISCYHPLKGFPIGVTDAGKTLYKILPYTVDHIEKRRGVWYAINSDKLSAYREASVRDFVPIPCGKCIGCRLDYSRQWANRMMLELELHDSAYFVTLTYDDLHVPRTMYADPDTGEALQALTLCKRDFQLWMKRLRKEYVDDNIRYFAAGEYGSQTARPHYHAIVFGLHLDDLEVFKKSPRGDTYYRSRRLEQTWSRYVKPEKQSSTACAESEKGSGSGYWEPFGHVLVAQVTWNTCAYVARYVTKKLDSDEVIIDQYGFKKKGPDPYEQIGIEKPFCLMSRRPGIAADWYKLHPDKAKESYINISTDDGGKKFAPPKYFDHFLELDDPEFYEGLKERRKKSAVAAVDARMKKTDLQYLDYLDVSERNHLARIKSLERNKC